MIKQLRWDETIGGDILTTLDNIQLASGFTSPILEKVDTTMDYIDNGWVLDLRQRLRSIKASLWVEKSWQPKLQRANDFSLMERFLRVKSTPLERKHLRMALHFMRVVTLADIADPIGSTIPGHKLTGDWRANTAWEWPKQPQPPRTAFATLRRFLRNTICQHDSPYQPIFSDLTITEPLGEWLAVERNILHDCLRHEDTIFCHTPGEGYTLSMTGKGQTAYSAPQDTSIPHL